MRSFTADENPLGATKVTFRGLDRNVAEKELNLLQFATSATAAPRASSTEFGRGEFVHANRGGDLLHDMPDELLRYSFAPSSTGATYTPKEPPRINTAGLCPVVQQTMHPVRDWNGSNVTCLAAQVYDCPMPFALLQVAESQLGELVATESRGQQ